ncbi:MAG: polysaccharide biosynthesis tyrosine autokinase [Bacteroidales bacterium]|nr:polysaccharide biosynthesis tyrosine autokinase [Bacteroidales bacterium]
MKKKENKIPTLNQDFELETFLTVLRKNIIVVIIFFALAITGGYLYFRYTQPIYSSYSIIQIKKENKTNEILGINSGVKMDPTIEIMRSEEFLKTVVKNLPLGISFFTEGAFLNTENYGSMPFKVDYEFTEGGLYDKPIYYEQNKDGKSYDISIGKDGAMYNVPFDKPTKIQDGVTLTMSAPNGESYIGRSSIKDKYYFVINSERQTLRNISKGLVIEALNNNAGTIKITYDCENARKSADIANAIAEQFIEFDVMKSRESSMATIAYIDEQMDNMVDELSTIESQLQQFRIANGITNDEVKSRKNGLAETRIANLEQRMSEIDYEIETLKEVKEQVNNNPDINMYEMMALMSGQSSNAFLSSMLKSLQDLMSKRESMLFEVTDNNHKIVVIDKQIESKKETIIDFIGSTIVRLEKQKASCEKKQEDIRNGIIEKANYDELEYSKLQRIYSVNESHYSKLLDRKIEILISQSGYVSTNLVLEKASVPSSAISPIFSKTMTMAVILALVLSILFLLARYLFYNKILTSNDISKYTDIPVIGEVVTSRHKNEFSQAVVHKNARSHITENFRKIRTNLDYYPLDSKCRVIITTSTVPGEGKTFIAINTADIYAMSGKKVLLVDFDLRKPRLEKCLNLDNEDGVSTILTNRKPWQECVHKDVIENMDVITSGPVTPIAAELLIGKNIDTFIEEVRAAYDIVILDTPPLGIIHDAITLSKYADNFFYIMRSGISVKGYIEYINGIVEEHNVKNISMVLNGLPVSKHSGYHYSRYGSHYGKYGYGYARGYGYGHSYGYGYGYGYSTDEDDDGSEKKEKSGFLSKLFGKKKK